MSLEDLIKINQLIRPRIDIEGFNAWYTSLSSDDQNSLITTLVDFAYQAGVYTETWDQAASIGEFTKHVALVDNIKSFHQTEIGCHDLTGFGSWLHGLSTADKNATFLIAVVLFGVAEGAVFRNESEASCNHWWHRDLLDTRVVAAIRNDPEYYLTAMKDDESLKSTVAPAISKPLVVFVIATPLFLFAAVASAGAGHGSYLLAKLLFPFTMFSTLMFGSIIAPAIVLAVLQFPFYGFILGRASVKGSFRTRAAVLLVIHVLAVAVCFILIGENFS